MTYHDLDDIRPLQPEGWPDIVTEFECYLKKNFCYPVKALMDRKIVGVGTLIVLGRTGWLAHIIVEEKHRNHGIGSQITRELVSEGRHQSVETLLLIATELGFPLYKKLGFKVVTEYHYFHRSIPWEDGPPSCQTITYEDHLDAEIFKLDMETSGEDRRVLLTDYLDKALVCMNNDTVEGFYMPDLGEGLIIANTVQAGTELMKVKYSRIDKAVLPIENAAGHDFLKQNGFARSDTKGTRMILGKDINWRPEQVYSRIGGNFG
jgi:GNAT superfamily N-acetyltransferase